MLISLFSDTVWPLSFSWVCRTSSFKLILTPWHIYVVYAYICARCTMRCMVADKTALLPATSRIWCHATEYVTTPPSATQICQLRWDIMSRYNVGRKIVLFWDTFLFSISLAPTKTMRLKSGWFRVATDASQSSLPCTKIIFHHQHWDTAVQFLAKHFVFWQKEYFFQTFTYRVRMSQAGCRGNILW